MHRQGTTMTRKVFPATKLSLSHFSPVHGAAVWDNLRVVLLTFIIVTYPTPVKFLTSTLNPTPLRRRSLTISLFKSNCMGRSEISFVPFEVTKRSLLYPVSLNKKLIPSQFPSNTTPIFFWYPPISYKLRNHFLLLYEGLLLQLCQISIKLLCSERQMCVFRVFTVLTLHKIANLDLELIIAHGTVPIFLVLSDPK